MNQDTTYTMKEMFTELRTDISERFDKVDAAQAHTNGDVTLLKVWRAYITGGLAVISAIVIPLLIYVWTEYKHTQVQLQSLSNNSQTFK